MILPVFGHDRFGILRGFWTFPQESILFQAKKATRKMTNHKSVSYACVGLFIMERLLSQIFTPERDIPKKWGVHGGIRVDAASQKLPLPLPPKEEITLNATITHNYQDYSPNVFAKLTTGYVKITKTAVTSTGKYGFGSELEVFGTTPQTKAPILRETGKTLFFPFSLLLYSCNVVQNREGYFVVNYKNK